jgi:hypothetical protein
MEEIEIAQIGSYSEENLSRLVRAVALEADAQLKQESPFDTGRFRGNWDADVEPLKASVLNNLPYAERLANGWSTQAPKGWIQTIGANLKAYAEAEARRIAGID